MNFSLASLVGLLIGAVLVLATLPLASRVARQDGDPFIGKVMRWGLVLKVLVAAPAQLLVLDVLYKGVADANNYNANGSTLAVQFSHGIFTLPSGAFNGTMFLKIFTGLVYSVIGVSKLGGFFVFSWLGFLGLFLFYRAFRLLFPDGDHRRYAVLVFLWPTLLFWPSAIGKDALMALALGASAYGGARAMKYKPLGFTIIGAGSVFALLIRPWMALMFCAAFGVAYLVRKPRQGASNSKLLKYGALAMLLVLGVFLASKTAHSVHIESLNATSINQVLNQNSVRGGLKAGRAGGMSHFAVSRNPITFPLNAFTVIFRPLPIEARGITSLASSFESVALLIVVALAWRPTLWPALRQSWRDPGVVLILSYTLLFIFVYSSLSDFGSLARERAQLFPFLFMLLAYNRAPMRRPAPVVPSPGWRPLVPPLPPSSRQVTVTS